MSNPQGPNCTIAAFTARSERYLRGYSRIRKQQLLRNLLQTRFLSADICWRELRFGDLAEFLTKEFRRFPNQWTQKA
jgi:hypothetical protein